MDARLRIATHEAGHAFVARALRLRAGGAFATAVAGESGIAAADNDSVYLHLAGIAAELVFFGDAHGGEYDRQRARELLHGGDLDAPLAEVRRLIHLNRDTVAKIAAALATAQTLSGPDIDRIVWGDTHA